MAQWAFSYPRLEDDSGYVHDEVRSGQVWTWEVESRPVPEGVMPSFAEVKQVIRCTRTIVDKSTGEISRESDYAVTNLTAQAPELYRVWRGHWGIENRSHHKRDVVFFEDACRTRKAARTLAALRNLILGLLHLRGEKQVKRTVRHFQAKPELVLELLGWQTHSG
jgi:hypothetical protein